MVSVFGDVLVAEDQPTILPVGGVFVLTRVRVDITGISQEYPWSALLRNRVRRAERTLAFRREIKLMMLQKAAAERKEAIMREFEADVRRKDKSRIVLLPR